MRQDVISGKFITFDGIDGAGKSTQIQHLADRLREQGHVVHVTREPGGTALSETIRDVLLSTDSKMSSLTELLLMFASRAEHVETVLRPKVAAGEWVICSRFTDATLAYQGYARGIDLQKIRQVAQVVHGDFNPDLSVFLDLPVSLAAERRAERGDAVDRFEAEDMAFMQCVRDGYLAIAESEPQRCKVIDAQQSVELIARDVLAKVALL